MDARVHKQLLQNGTVSAILTSSETGTRLHQCVPGQFRLSWVVKDR
jgi:hypothetical protein